MGSWGTAGRKRDTASPPRGAGPLHWRAVGARQAGAVTRPLTLPTSLLGCAHTHTPNTRARTFARTRAPTPTPLPHTPVPHLHRLVQQAEVRLLQEPLQHLQPASTSCSGVTTRGGLGGALRRRVPTSHPPRRCRPAYIGVRPWFWSRSPKLCLTCEAIAS